MSQVKQNFMVKLDSLALVSLINDLEDRVSDEFYKDIILADEKAVVNMIRSIKKEFGKIDIFLNNAGIASMNHFLTTSFQTVQNIFATNFFGIFLFSRKVFSL